jgi:large subunit ribosomal protein L22
MKYSIKTYDKDHMARAIGIALPISFKQSVEICNFIRKKSVVSAKKQLGEVLEKKRAIPFRRFNFDLGHKKKIGPGRYPESASKEFIRLIESVEANAQFKGINTSNLIISHASANKAAKAWHYGRQSRRRMKRTNVEILVEEKKAERKEEKKEEKKQKSGEKK